MLRDPSLAKLLFLLNNKLAESDLKFLLIKRLVSLQVTFKEVKSLHKYRLWPSVVCSRDRACVTIDSLKLRGNESKPSR